MDTNKNIKDIVAKAKQIILKKDEEISFLQMGLKNAMGGREPILLKMPNEIRVENIGDVKVVADVKFPDIQKVRVVSQEGKNHDKASKWVPALVTSVVKGIVGSVSTLWAKGIEVYSSDEDKLRPQAVIVVDSRGKPVNLGNIGMPSFIPFPGGGGRSGTPPPTTLGSGRKTVTTPGVAEKLVSSPTLCRKVVVTCPTGNGGEVYVGGSTVSAVAGSQKGLLLLAIGSASIDIDDVSKIWIDSTVAGEGVTFTYFT